MSNAGRKSKYDPNTFPLLAEGYFRDGLTDEQVSAKLGINPDTFYEYLKKYPDFSEAVRNGKRPVDIEVENALLKRAKGYDVEIVKTQYVEDEANGKSGNKKNTKAAKSKRITKVTKHIVGDVTAQRYWLLHRCRKKWGDQDITAIGNVEIHIDGDDAKL